MIYYSDGNSLIANVLGIYKRKQYLVVSLNRCTELPDERCLRLHDAVESS